VEPDPFPDGDKMRTNIKHIRKLHTEGYSVYELANMFEKHPMTIANMVGHYWSCPTFHPEMKDRTCRCFEEGEHFCELLPHQGWGKART
jgi:hypothetical protein